MTCAMRVLNFSGFHSPRSTRRANRGFAVVALARTTTPVCGPSQRSRRFAGSLSVIFPSSNASTVKFTPNAAASGDPLTYKSSSGSSAAATCASALYVFAAPDRRHEMCVSSCQLRCICDGCHQKQPHVFDPVAAVSSVHSIFLSAAHQRCLLAIAIIHLRSSHGTAVENSCCDNHIS